MDKSSFSSIGQSWEWSPRNDPQCDTSRAALLLCHGILQSHGFIPHCLYLCSCCRDHRLHQPSPQRNVLSCFLQSRSEIWRCEVTSPFLFTCPAWESLTTWSQFPSSLALWNMYSGDCTKAKRSDLAFFCFSVLSKMQVERLSMWSILKVNVSESFLAACATQPFQENIS